MTVSNAWICETSHEPKYAIIKFVFMWILLRLTEYMFCNTECSVLKGGLGGCLSTHLGVCGPGLLDFLGGGLPHRWLLGRLLWWIWAV